MTDDEQGPGWAEAMAELEQILVGLEADDVDVDVLAEQVRRAAELITACRDRIAAARFEVTRVVAELAAEPDGVDDGDGEDEAGGGDDPGQEVDGG